MQSDDAGEGDGFLQQFILSCTAAVAVGEERVAAAN